MAEQMLTGSIAAPGFYGLDTQDSSVQLSNGFALEANNCIIDKYGRIGARKGWTKVNPTAFNGSSVRTIFEFVKSDGNLTFAAANNKIYGTHPSTGAYLEYPVGGTLFYPSTTCSYSQTGTTVTCTQSSHAYTVGMTIYFSPVTGTADEGIYTVTSVAGSNFTFTSPSSETTSGTCNTVNILTTYSITDDNWQAVNMPYGTGITNSSAHSVWVQSGHIPLVLHKLGTTGHTHTDGYGFQRLGDIATLPTGYTVTTFKPSCALTSFGRLWVANVGSDNTQVVYFSDLQDPANWTTGTSGRLDISTVIPTGDPIVALAQHNGFLVIFCKKHIVIYSGATTPSTMTLHDVITGVGCIARDSIASVAGTDLLFLSETGVQSLQRVIQEKSLPFRDVSKNVRDELLTYVRSETLENIKGTYYPSDAMYLLALPESNITYCFDTRGALETGAARTTVWTDINPTAFCNTQSRDLYVGQVGYIGKYEDYTDNGSSYRMSYYTNYFDFGQPTQTKILKKVNVVAIGGSSQPISFKWGFDYTFNYNSQTVTLIGSTVYEYGIAEYGIAEYSTGISLENVKANLGGSGKVLQLGFETDVNGVVVSIQKIDFSLKQGKNLI